jgi:hypothetical protein
VSKDRGELRRCQTARRNPKRSLGHGRRLKRLDTDGGEGWPVCSVIARKHPGTPPVEVGPVEALPIHTEKAHQECRLRSQHRSPRSTPQTRSAARNLRVDGTSRLGGQLAAHPPDVTKRCSSSLTGCGAPLAPMSATIPRWWFAPGPESGGPHTVSRDGGRPTAARRRRRGRIRRCGDSSVRDQPLPSWCRSRTSSVFIPTFSLFECLFD